MIELLLTISISTVVILFISLLFAAVYMFTGTAFSRSPWSRFWRGKELIAKGYLTKEYSLEEFEQIDKVVTAYELDLAKLQAKEINKRLQVHLQHQEYITKLIDKEIS